MLLNIIFLLSVKFSLQTQAPAPTAALPQSILGLIDEVSTKAPPGQEIFSVSDDKGSVCTMATLEADVLISAADKELQVQMPDHVTTDPDSNCGFNNSQPLLVLTWPSYKLCFFISKASQNWTLDSIVLVVNSSELALSNTKKKEIKLFTKNNGTLLEAPLGNSYRCFASVTYELKSDPETNVSARLVLSNLQIQPYLEGAPKFSQEIICREDVVNKVVRRRNDTVTIAVGSTLAVLAMATVVAYAIYRHIKVKSFGYDTMQ